jgi:RNA polymerase sigma-70 factor, ECF subfamily
MTEVDSQRQEDELLTNVKAVAPAASDEVLVAAAKLGDRLAFMELWTRHSVTAFKVAFRIMGNRDDAEDVIQERG